ncbi:MAG: hypothetical protein ACTS3F_13500 [Phycisphaerales bacterium]
MQRAAMAARMTMAGALVAGAGLLGLASGAQGAQRLIASQAGADLVVGVADVTVMIDFGSVGEPVTGIGFIGDWTAIVADEQNGVRPWSTDMIIRATNPGGAQVLNWGPTIGGDRTIADFPFQDATQAGTETPDGSGVWSFTVDSGNPSPFVIGLNEVSWHLLTDAPDVESAFEFSVADGPEWDRPFFIAGISGLGPTFYRVLEFTPEVSGLYRFDSVVSNGFAFTLLYEDSFDPEDQLTNLLDYGLGNGNAPNGAPAGTSLIEALLLEGTTYYFVVSQWDRFTLGQSYDTTVTGPGGLLEPVDPCPGDLNDDSMVDSDDLAIVLSAFGAGAGGDLNGDGKTDSDDLGILLGVFGASCQ